MNFNSEAFRREMIAKRVIYKANSKIGHRCSIVIEMDKHLQNGAVGEQREHLERNFAKTMREIDALELAEIL